MAEPHPAGEEDEASGRMIRDEEMEEISDKGSAVGGEDGATGGTIEEEDFAHHGRDCEVRGPIILRKPHDIETYAGQYCGRTKIKRLCFIADYCEDREMKLEALKLAYDEIKKTGDTMLFKEVVAKINGRLGEAYGPDDAWVYVVERQAELKEERLINELEAYKFLFSQSQATSMRERVVMAYSALGHVYYEHGHLGEALESYASMQDYCSSANHVIYMCFSVILVCIEMRMPSRVASYVTKALTLDDLDPISMGKLSCASGLAKLEDREYEAAALKFLQVTDVVVCCYSEEISSRDIAIYGVLCALATFNQAELKIGVIDNFEFRTFLQLAPDIRKLIVNFHDSRFVPCLTYLNDMKPTFLLDIHLHDHVEELYSLIRKKALIQYTNSSRVIDLRIMEDAFKTSVMDLEKEVAELIIGDQIQALIDSQAKVLRIIK